MILGIKCWYADGTKIVIPMKGQSHSLVSAAVLALPANTLQLIMVYFDEFSTVTCPNGHNQPFRPDRICVGCGANIADLGIRYRRMVQGNNHYFIVYDILPPRGLQDWLVGQTDNIADLLKYPGAMQFNGSFVNDTAYRAYVDAAMSDFDVSEFGMRPIGGTTDR